jgi:serine/threonine-protein kinase
MAPEHALGQTVDGRTDQYALAIVGFQMLTGQVPFDDETPHAIIHLHINEAPPRLATLRPDVPAHLAAAIARGMMKSPAHRFATMEEFAAALGTPDTAPTMRVLAGDDRAVDRAVDRVFSPRQPARERPRATWVAFAAGVLLLLAGSAAWVGSVSLRTPRRAPDKPRTATARPSTTAPASVAQQGSPSAPARSTSVRRRTTVLTVSSSPSAELFIDGKRIGKTPVVAHTVTVGHEYQIRLERKGYRTKRETIDVANSRPIRRTYSLERSEISTTKRRR